MFVIWYGGHGVLFKTSTHIVVNERDPKLRYFPLEINLNQFSNCKYTYTFVFLDCCRSPLNEEYMPRGDRIQEFVEQVGQIKFIYSCQPGDVTPADSKLSQHVLEDIERQIEENGFVQTICHHHIRAKNPKIDTRDNISRLLYLEVDGSKPEPVIDFKEENMSLKQEIL